MTGEGEPIRTIVVDDSPAALNAMCAVVSRERILRFVGAARTGREALVLARSLHPDLVLLDLDMPVMDGIEATIRLRRDCPESRIVIVTVHDSAELRKLCFERGASGFLKKNALSERLRPTVMELFADASVNK